MMRAAVLAAALACLATLAAAQPASPQNAGRIRIIGRATVEVPPDHVTVRVGVSSTAPTPTAALDQNSAVARKIIDFSKKSGVEDRDIQTDAVSLSPIFKTVREPGGGTRQEPNGYMAGNAVHVRLSDLARLGTYLRQVLDQGATNIAGVQFGLSNPEKVMDEARTKAVEDAVRQAQQLTEAAKVKLGRIQEIVHPPRSDARVADGVADMVLRSRARMTVPVEAGVLQVGAEVEITWAVE